MLKRIITGSIGIIFLIFIIYFLPKIYFFLFVFFIILLAHAEFLKIFEKNFLNLKFLFSVITTVLFELAFIQNNFFKIVSLLIIFFLSVFSTKLIYFKSFPGKLKDFVLFTVENVYITFFLCFGILIYLSENGKNLLMLLLIIAWAGDTFAYIIGTKFGKRKLYYKLSPNKTIEGAVGGFICAIISAIIFNYFMLKISILKLLMLSSITAIFCILGDLFESMIKRINNVKDSGSLLPGHGGILDRIDSLFFAVPVFFILIKL